LAYKQKFINVANLLECHAVIVPGRNPFALWLLRCQTYFCRHRSLYVSVQ